MVQTFSRLARLPLLVLVISASCTTHEAGPFVVAAAMRPPDRTYGNPPDSVQSHVVSALRSLSFDIAKIQNGEIATAPMVYKGREAGLWLWRGFWEERAVIRVSLLRSYTGNATVMFVSASTEERPNEHYHWKPTSRSEGSAKLEQRFLSVLDRMIKPK
jgi:hypothetical protein